MTPMKSSITANYDGGGRRSQPQIQDNSTTLVDTAKPIVKAVATYFGGPAGAKGVDMAYDKRQKEYGLGNNSGDGIANKAADMYGGGGFDMSKLASLFG